MIHANLVSIVDRHSWVAPFGVRFFDAVSGDQVREGLRVSARAVDEPRRRIEATVTAGGTYALHSAPGLGREIRGRGDDEYWSQPPRTREFAFEVVDAQSRYNPVGFNAYLPARGLFRPDCAALSPPLPGSGVRLYPRPTRAARHGMAAVRAQLKSTETNEPAAWARIVARYRGNMLGDAIADEGGGVLLNFPYPELVRPRPTSPPRTAPSATWTIDLLIFHSPALSSGGIPDYCSMLLQPAARLIEMRSPPREISEITVEFGRETVVASVGESCLFVAPA